MDSKVHGQQSSRTAKFKDSKVQGQQSSSTAKFKDSKVQDSKAKDSTDRATETGPPGQDSHERKVQNSEKMAARAG